MTQTPAPAAADLAARLADVTAVDERRLRGRLRSVRRITDDAKRDRVLADIDRQVRTAEARMARRRAAVPTLRYPPELPVSDRVDDLAAAIGANQVVIVAGETGSGKSTQLPKICLQIGRGVRGTIGHTQPRRIAARALAERIAEETGTTVGGAVGYAIRFGDHTGPDTLVKLMTDGILLNEIVRDRMLWAYDTIIIDEAHERSLNIDFLLGYLKELLPRRPDLKLIITSATIDPRRFSRHFGDAPVVEVSGRTYPVEIRYRPYGLDDQSDPDDAPEQAEPSRVNRGAAAARAREEAIDQAQAICDAADELMRGRGWGHPGIPLRRTRDHRHRRGSARAPGLSAGRHRGVAAVRPALRRRPAQGLLGARRPAHRAGHQRRRDLADGAGHPVRHRSRNGADLPVLAAQQGAAAADRTDLAGLRRPARRALRAGRRRHLHPAVLARTTSCPARNSPTRRSPAPRWPR